MVVLSRNSVNPRSDGSKDPNRLLPGSVTWPMWQAVTSACHQTTEALQELFQSFWGIPVRLQLFSISHHNTYLWQGDDFHVSQVPLENEAIHPKLRGFHNPSGGNYQVELRLSNKACALMFDSVLGQLAATDQPKAIPFSFQNLSGFEAFLLDKFVEELFAILFKNLVKRALDEDPEVPLVHIIWLVDFSELERRPASEKRDHQVGKLVLTLPFEGVSIANQEQGEAEIQDVRPVLGESPLLDTELSISIHVGETRLTLEEVKHLESGDVVLLEQSKAEEMAIVIPKSHQRIPFPISIENRKNYELLKTQELEAMEQQQQDALALKEDLWDNLQIDVNAEFAATRIPLRQLKEMSEGLVVEISNLIQNKIRLHVKGKTLAHGELVIIGDKFGVLITELLNDSDEAKQKALPGASANQLTGGTETPAAMAAGAMPDTQEGEPGNPMSHEDIGGMSDDMYGSGDMEQHDQAFDESMMNEVDNFLNNDFDEEETF